MNMNFENFLRELESVSLIAQGWRGKVYSAFWKGCKVSVKVAKDKLLRRAIRKEADLLSRLRGLEGFPQIIACGEDFFVYEFIEGKPMREVKLSPEEKRRVYRKLLSLAFKLDRMGINRDEFSRIEKNVLIGEDGDVYVLDFERGSVSDRPTNITQFIQLLRREGFLEHEEAIMLGKRYHSDGEGVFKLLSAKLK